MGNFIAGVFIFLLLTAILGPYIGPPLFLIIYYFSKRAAVKRDERWREEARRKMRAEEPEEPSIEVDVVAVNQANVSYDDKKKRQDNPQISSYEKIIHSSKSDKRK